MWYQCRHHSLSMGTKTGDAGTWKVIKKPVNEKLLRRLCLFVCLSGTPAPPSPQTCPRPIHNPPNSPSHTAEDEWFHYSDAFWGGPLPACCWLPPSCQTIYTPGGRRAWWKTLGFRLLICQPFIILQGTERQTNLNTSSSSIHHPLPGVELSYPSPCYCLSMTALTWHSKNSNYCQIITDSISSCRSPVLVLSVSCRSE